MVVLVLVKKSVRVNHVDIDAMQTSSCATTNAMNFATRMRTAPASNVRKLFLFVALVVTSP